MNAIAIAVVLGIIALGAFVIVRKRGTGDADVANDPPTEIDNQSATKPPEETPSAAPTKIQPAVTDIYAEEQHHDLNEGLSHSGAVTIGAEVKRCIDAELWDEAISWLLHASDALPDRTDFKVTLAEVYAKTDDRENFTALFEKLYVDIDDTSEDMERLLRVARDFVPEHAIFQA